MSFEINGEIVQWALFAVFAAAAVMGALSVVAARDPFISALSLILNFASLGTLYILVDAPYVAIAQVIVYAGAVVVLFLFVMAYLGDRREVLRAAHRARGLAALGAVTAVLMAAVLVVSIVHAAFPEPPARGEIGRAFGSAQSVGELFLTKYLLAFEVTSLILLVAAVGGIVLGLTGRERHRRLRREMRTTSADQWRRIARERADRDELPEGDAAPAASAQEVSS